MHLKSDNIGIMINDKVVEVIEKLFESLLSRYQVGLVESMKVSHFIFDYIHLLHFKCHKMNQNHVGSYRYIDSPVWKESKKSTINVINKGDNKCFQYVTTLALNHWEIGKYWEEISNVKSFLDKYNWKDTTYHQEKMTE